MRVKDRMSSPAITVGARNTLKEALEIMKNNNIRRLPVVEGDILVGMLVQHDIETALQKPGIIQQTPVEWVMTRNPLTVGPEDDLVFAAVLLRDYKISGLPVMEDNQLVGIITDMDIIQAFIELYRED